MLITSTGTVRLAFATKSAIAWRLVDGLARRPRPGVDLRVAILRPGGGQYFCVSLVDPAAMKPVLMMNLRGSSLWIQPLATPRIARDELRWARDGYLDAVLAHGTEAVVDDIEALLGLRAWEPRDVAVTPALLGIRVIAGVMERRVFSAHGFVAECGYHDSSDGSGVNEWVSAFPALYERTRHVTTESSAFRLASRVFRITPARRPGPAVCLDLGSGEAVVEGPNGLRLHLPKRYVQAGGHLGPLVSWIVDRLEGH